ncbi:MAG: trehalose-phosphatase [Dehalococcoidales bacterium]|nr:trehalose-phosphatase [Dehalococcoidales bacterium]
MRYLPEFFAEIREKICRAGQTMLLLDYDGTLTPIVERPEDAHLAEDTHSLLRQLAGIPSLLVGVISGRSLADLKGRVGVEGLIYAGNHGFEIESPQFKYIHPAAEAARPVLEMIRNFLVRSTGHIEGVLLEDKGLTLSLHYRLVMEEDLPELREIMDKAMAGAVTRGLVRVSSGKKVYEFRPAVPWDKGKAVRFLMKSYQKGGRQSGMLVVYLGDDTTDEDAFRVVRRYGHGVGVHVGGDRPDSAAEYWVKSVDEVLSFLGEILRCLKDDCLKSDSLFISD